MRYSSLCARATVVHWRGRENERHFRLKYNHLMLPCLFRNAQILHTKSLRFPVDSHFLFFNYCKLSDGFRLRSLRPVHAHPGRHISQQQQRPLHPVQAVGCRSEVRASTRGLRGLSREGSALTDLLCPPCPLLSSMGGVALVSFSSMENADDKGAIGNVSRAGRVSLTLPD